MQQSLSKRHLLGIDDLSIDDVKLILDTAFSLKEISFRDIKKVPTLRGKTVINCFFESSTRTRLSFEIAEKRLSADTINITVSGSAIEKGENLPDTIKNIHAMQPDLIVIRHRTSGMPYLLSKIVDCPIINAGDGVHEHPTQALLDLMTIMEAKGKIEGLNVSIVGDIRHSRVAASNMRLLKKMGANVHIVGPKTMIPPFAEEVFGVTVHYDIREVLPYSDIVMMLRIQMERQGSALFPTAREYSRYFGLNAENIKLARKDVLIMHPGPVNRGVEIAPEIADGEWSIILDQVTNGVAVRMAVLYLLCGSREEG